MTSPNSTSTDGLAIYDRSGAPITLTRYIELHGDENYRILAGDRVGEREVVTAWLGIDHGLIGDECTPPIFTTVVLEPDGQPWQGREFLAASEVEARRHHKDVVAQLS